MRLTKKQTKADLPSEVSNKYALAYDEWEGRIGSAKTQAKNWRLACLVSVFIILLLLVCIIMLISSQERYVYVAEVQPGNHVVNVQQMGAQVEASRAQQTVIISNFIQDIMSIPLDPVVLRKQWVDAYQLSTGQAVNQLDQFMQKTNPFQQVGKVTQSVYIESVTQVGNYSFDVTWSAKTIDRTGKTVSIKLYGGVFTLVKAQKAETLQQLFINPTNLKLGYFSFNEKGAS